jgi:hypothetical protein
MLKTIALVAVAAVSLVLVAAAFRPDTFRVQRSVRIDAPPQAVHPLINNLAQMNSWSPFVKRDPNLRGSYRGPAEGPGAGYDFAGNREVGKGSVDILASSPQRITMRLHMREPMEGLNTVEFTLLPQGAGTEVTWAMHGPSPYVSRLVGLVLDMDKMVGGAFEAGLAELKTRAERRA